MELQAIFRQNNVNELIKTEQSENGEIIVSGRDLHEFLGATERYNSWIKRMIGYGFEEGVDFTSVKTFTLVNNGAEREIDNHALKLDMAKQVGMIQKTEKGKQIREYFIKLESFWNSPEMVELRYNEMQKKKIEVLTREKFMLETKIEKLTHTGKLYTASELAKECGFKSAKAFNKILHEKKFQFYSNGTWLPYADHADKGYVSLKLGEYNGKAKYDRKFTELGRQFILDLFD